MFMVRCFLVSKPVRPHQVSSDLLRHPGEELQDEALSPSPPTETPSPSSSSSLGTTGFFSLYSAG